ncbi:MAG: DUF7674 family protein [Aureliella sp.]
MSFRNAFLGWAAARLPSVREELVGENRQMRVYIAFRRFREETQAAMDERRTAEVVELFQMADRVLACAFPNMRSLFHVVYVEDLRFDEWSWALVTPRLKAEFQRSIAWTPDRSKRYR